MTARVVVVGAVNVDLVVTADRLPAPGETVVGPRMVRTGGGKGANAAVAAAAAGATTLLIGAVGDDDGGHFAANDLAARGVEVSSMVHVPGEATGTALIVVDAAGENQIAVGLGANAMLSPHVVTTRLGEVLRPGDCVLVSTEIPGSCVIAAVHAAHRAETRCVLNPAPVVAEVAELLDYGVLLTPNAGEARDLARLLGLGTNSLDEIGVRLAERTAQPVVITLGADGALAVDAGSHAVVRTPARPVQRVLDTTGAGDCFNGSLVAALAGGATLVSAVSAGMAAAADSVQWVGARPADAAFDTNSFSNRG